MLNQKRIRNYGVEIGQLETGRLNAITDVADVTGRHITLSDENVQTAVTAIIPHQENIFENKFIASSHVINGFGKTMGTIQIAELGIIKSPILLTNTISIAVAADTLTNCTSVNNTYIVNLQLAGTK